MITAGIDAGSRAIKVVIRDTESDAILASGVEDQGVNQAELPRALYEKLLTEVGLSPDDVAGVVATGYGRYNVDFATKRITEITCHARGVRQVVPEARTVIDIGGQDSKLIRLDGKGTVQDFMMNDRCAAGTGCFLEVVARKLELQLDQLGEVALRSTNPAAISSMCVVFAETEIVGLLSSGTPPEDIVAGVQAAVVKRVASMAGGTVDEPVVFAGGVALIPGMREAFEATLGMPVTVAPHAQLTGALGAACLAARP